MGVGLFNKLLRGKQPSIENQTGADYVSESKDNNSPVVSADTQFELMASEGAEQLDGIPPVRRLIEKDIRRADNIRKALHSQSFVMPEAQKYRNEIATLLVLDVEQNLETVNETVSFDEYIESYETMLFSLDTIAKYAPFLREKIKNEPGSIAAQAADARLRYQARIHGVIERCSKDIIKNYKGVYKYDTDYIVERIQTLREDIQKNQDKMNEENKQFAHATLLYLSKECNVSNLIDLNEKTEATNGNTFIQNEDNIDGMDGHQFEYYCADLLRSNGFRNVSVTPGSGDQGVDILAEKEGIKYAIQCKNYSSALSNTPVQEVNAGKMFYNCHVGVVMTNSTFTPGAIALANATGVLLWDRAHLQSMMKESRSYTDVQTLPANEMRRLDTTEVETDIKEDTTLQNKNSNFNEKVIQATELLLEEKSVDLLLLGKHIRVKNFSELFEIVGELEQYQIAHKEANSVLCDITQDEWKDFRNEHGIIS